MIRRNAARCNVCGTIIESKHNRHFVSCPCGNLSVDGGRFSLNRSIQFPNSWTELSDYDEDDL